MRKLIGVLVFCALSFPALCQTKSKYQVATILEIKAHQAEGKDLSEATTYDVSVKVDDTVYVVLYTPPPGEVPQKYAAGREMLVLVGAKAITYHDLLGESFQAPIESQRPAADPVRTK